MLSRGRKLVEMVTSTSMNVAGELHNPSTSCEISQNSGHRYGKVCFLTNFDGSHTIYSHNQPMSASKVKPEASYSSDELNPVKGNQNLPPNEGLYSDIQSPTDTWHYCGTSRIDAETFHTSGGKMNSDGITQPDNSDPSTSSDIGLSAEDYIPPLVQQREVDHQGGEDHSVLNVSNHVVAPTVFFNSPSSDPPIIMKLSSSHTCPKKIDSDALKPTDENLSPIKSNDYFLSSLGMISFNYQSPMPAKYCRFTQSGIAQAVAEATETDHDDPSPLEASFTPTNGSNFDLLLEDDIPPFDQQSKVKLQVGEDCSDQDVIELRPLTLTSLLNPASSSLPPIIQELSSIPPPVENLDSEVFNLTYENLTPVKGNNHLSPNGILHCNQSPKNTVQCCELSQSGPALVTAEAIDSDQDDSSGLEAPSTPASTNGSEFYQQGTANTNDQQSGEEHQARASNSNSSGRPKKGRKRKFEDQTRLVRKQNCLMNKRYINWRGRMVNPKEFLENTGCDKHQCNKVSLQDRKSEFDLFWGLTSFESKVLFISTRVQVSDLIRKRVIGPTFKNKTRRYSLNGKTVCKNCFTKTLRISGSRVDSYLKKIASRQLSDGRKNTGGKNRLPQFSVDEVITHINKFPRYKSHYCRSTTNSEFLPQGVTIKVMHELYKTQVPTPVSLSTYKKVFYSNFNLRRKRLKKDTCAKCDAFAARMTMNPNVQQERDKHQEAAERARAELKADVALSKNPEEKTTVLTFDMQKTLPLPRIPSNVAYYKRQLCFYNCGIHDCGSNQGFFNVWVEGEAGRGAQEVGSCLLKHIANNVPDTTEKLILWSDSCGGQNRNIKIVLLMKCALEIHTSLKSIHLKYLVPGHTFLPNDDEFGDIECALKLHQELYTPEQYIDVILNSRGKRKFVVSRVQRNDFKSSKSLELQIVNRKKDVTDQPISWLQTRELKVEKNRPFSMYMRQKFNGDWQEVDVSKQRSSNGGRGRRRKGPSAPTPTFRVNLDELWPNGKPISTPKLADIRSMMELIPPEYQSMYKNLTGCNSVEDDIDGYSGELDFEIEAQDDSLPTEE